MFGLTIEMKAILQKLLQIDSVLDESTVSIGAPFGEGIKNALEAFLEMAKKDGADIIIGTDPDCDRVGVDGCFDIGHYIRYSGIIYIKGSKRIQGTSSQTTDIF